MRIDTSHIKRMANAIYDILGNDFDEQTFLDTLDGETDVMDAIGYLIKDREEAKAFAAACKEHAKTYTERAKRLEDRAEAMTRAMGELLDATQQRKIAHPLGTVSRTKGRQTVQIVNEADVPSQLCKVVSAPDKAAIKAQLDAGETVPGAVLQTSPDGVSVRVK